MSGRMSRTIYVGNLPPDTREWEIEDLFYKYGRIVDVELKIPPRPPGYCFVEFEDVRDAEDAIRGRDGYNFDGCRLRVELAHGGRGHSSSSDRRSGYGGGGGGGSGRYGVSRRSEYRVVIRGLPSSASWQDLKDHMRKAGDVCFAQVFRDGDGTMGIVDYTNHEDMKYAVRKLDDTEFKNPFARSYIRVKAYEGSPSKSRSRSRSRSPRRNRSKSRSISRSLSNSRSPRSASPAKISRSRSLSESPREVRSNGEILSQVVSSQSDLLARYGGVAPKMAEEAHAQAIDGVVQRALDDAKIEEGDLSAVAVTIGPGLSLCLRVGVRKARKIAGEFRLPIVGVHHMEAHALVARLLEKDLQFPFLALLISGGHNLLLLARDLGLYVQLGTTIDDAIGEAYDKTARWLGLDMYKGGGPALEEIALEGNANSVKFSTPMKQHKDCNFSYAGLKTQVRLAIESIKINTEIPLSLTDLRDRQKRADIAASFQKTAVLHLEERCERAIQWALEMEPSVKYLVASGGVASNKYVRARLHQVVKLSGLQLVCPPPSLCTDNGVMIAWTGIEHFRLGRSDPPPPASEPEDSVFDLRPRWPLGEEYSKGRSDARSMKRARVHPSLTSIIQASM